jgi:opacity protein-like surface antigen
MRKRFLIYWSVVLCFSVFLFSLPVMAEPLAGTQIALRAITADDAEPAADEDMAHAQPSKPAVQSDKTGQSPQPEPPKTVKTEQKNKQADFKESAKESVRIQEPQRTAEDSTPRSIEEQVKALQQEIRKIRDENEARKRLEVPEEEKGQTIQDILSAAGRQYTLLKQGTIGLSYNLAYSYFSSDAISDVKLIERRSNHNLTNTITAEYALFNNLTISAGIPFAYKYNRVGTASAQEATDLGDITVGLTVQPFKAGGSIPTPIFSLGASFPTGTSPYEVDQTETLATGAGYYSVGGGFSLSKVVDPLVAFGSLNYNYGFKQSVDQYWSKTQTLNEVEPGGSLGLSMGFGYALSYLASLNMSAQVSYSFGSKYTINKTQTYESGSSLSASFNVGTGWRVTEARSIYVSMGIGLTNNDADFSLNFRLPFEF